MLELGCGPDEMIHFESGCLRKNCGSRTGPCSRRGTKLRTESPNGPKAADAWAKDENIRRCCDGRQATLCWCNIRLALPAPACSPPAFPSIGIPVIDCLCSRRPFIPKHAFLPNTEKHPRTASRHGRAEQPPQTFRRQRHRFREDRRRQQGTLRHGLREGRCPLHLTSTLGARDGLRATDGTGDRKFERAGRRQ